MSWFQTQLTLCLINRFILSSDRIINIGLVHAISLLWIPFPFISLWKQFTLILIIRLLSITIYHPCQSTLYIYCKSIPGGCRFFTVLKKYSFSSCKCNHHPHRADTNTEMTTWESRKKPSLPHSQIHTHFIGTIFP